MKLETLKKELEDILSSLEFEEGGGIFITSTDWLSDDMKIKFVIKAGVEERNQLWEVQVKGVRDELIKSDITDELELFEEHPLLWAHNQRQVNLYFGHPSSRPCELFPDIYLTHSRLMGNWTPFNKYVNANISIIDLSKLASGLFASGPIKLMEEYKGILESHNMNPTIVGGHNPKRWLNGHQVDETEILKVLVIGQSYVIAEGFDFNRAWVYR